MTNMPNEIRFAKQQPHRAKIFLSCGQATSEEREFAKKLQNKLHDEYKFDVFVAASESTIKELDRELLDHLKTSDYFLCINFQRELVSDPISKRCFYRGSLYTNQEIAMAAAVGFSSSEMIILSHKSVDRDGLLRNIVRNDCDFTDHVQLTELVYEKIKEREWNYQYSRSIKLLEVQFNDEAKPWSEISRHTRLHRRDWLAWLDVRNDRKDLVATNCMLHLKRIFSEEGKELLNSEQYPLKACFVGGFSHTIFPEETVRFDLLAVEENTCDVFLRSNKDFRPDGIKEFIASGKGIYQLEYELFADMFPITTFRVDLAVGMKLPDKIDSKESL